MLPPHVIVVENAWLAKMAAIKMGSQRVAMVIGRRIYLWGVSKTDFLQQPAWVKHELAHVAQYQRYGVATFLFLYVLEWIKKGYYNNRFEVEARAAEQAP
jgi:uncharacterized protein YjaZ